jgi:WD40 repeat protein
MTSDADVVFNGLDGASGGYFVTASPEQIAEIAKGDRVSKQHFDNLVARLREREETLGVVHTATVSRRTAGRALDFSPDGKWLATGGDDHEVHMYPVELPDLIALAKQHVTRQLTPEECAAYLPNQPCP